MAAQPLMVSRYNRSDFELQERDGPQVHRVARVYGGSLERAYTMAAAELLRDALAEAGGLLAACPLEHWRSQERARALQKVEAALALCTPPDPARSTGREAPSGVEDASGEAGNPGEEGATP